MSPNGMKWGVAALNSHNLIGSGLARRVAVRCHLSVYVFPLGCATGSSPP
jgi:hypothetical protein